MRLNQVSYLLATMLLLVSCSAPLIPEPRPSRALGQHSVLTDTCGETESLNRLRQDWQVLWNPKQTETERQQAMSRYNAELLELLRHWRYLTVKEGILPLEDTDIRYDGKITAKGMMKLFSDVVPSADIPKENLEEHYSVPGLGVPMVGIIPPENVGNAEKTIAIKSRGTVCNMTAVLTFDAKGKPRLEFIQRHRTETYRNGRRTLPLAGNFSAPIEIYWDLTQIRKDRYLGLLRPQKLRDTTGLTCMEQYDPNKIPVILTHGLASSAATFDQLVNRLMEKEEVRRHYQFWYFNYPTGTAWTQTATLYRQALEDVRKKLDPQHSNRNWDRMVVIGHSMGGLITHYSQCLEPWKMLEAANHGRALRIRPLLNEHYVNHPLPISAHQLEPFRRDYCFAPVKAGMVVYMATPHKGAPLAHYRIIATLTRLVHLPQALLQEAYNLATLQEDLIIINPSKLTEWFTSVNQLSPGSYSIRGLQGLAVRDVPTHSFIGNQGACGPLEETTDGIVPYWSSHFEKGTETIIPTDHHVQDAAETAEKLADILCDYAKKR